jgi:hypothetical protein
MQVLHFIPAVVVVMVVVVEVVVEVEVEVVMVVVVEVVVLVVAVVVVVVVVVVVLCSKIMKMIMHKSTSSAMRHYNTAAGADEAMRSHHCSFAACRTWTLYIPEDGTACVTMPNKNKTKNPSQK